MLKPHKQYKNLQIKTVESKTISLFPMNGRILILPIEKEKITTSGLYVANVNLSSEKPQVGTIIKLGLEKNDDKGNKIPFIVKEGASVMYKKYVGDEIEFEEKKYLLIEERDIMAIYED